MTRSRHSRFSLSGFKSQETESQDLADGSAMQVIFRVWKIFLLRIDVLVRFSQVITNCLCVILQFNIEKDKSLPGGDITILGPALHHVGKSLGDDGGHQSFGMIFEVGHFVLGQRYPGHINDPVQL